MSYFFPVSWNPLTESIDVSFNSSDFTDNYGTVLKGDLKDYANKQKSNIFIDTNYFTNILVQSINGVTSSTLDFLKDIRENVQEVLDILKGKTTNINCNGSVTEITETTLLDNATVTNNINCNHTASMKTLCQKIVCNDLIVTDIVSNEIKCGVLKATNVTNVACYMFLVNGRTVPIVKSGAIKTMAPSITGRDEFICEFTLMPGYKIVMNDNRGQILFVLSNDTSDVLYSVNCTLNEIPYNINVYFQDMLI